MGHRTKARVDRDVVERAEFVERTVRDVCALLRDGRGYGEISEHIERAQGALQSIRTTLWRRELLRAVGRHGPRVP